LYHITGILLPAGGVRGGRVTVHTPASRMPSQGAKLQTDFASAPAPPFGTMPLPARKGKVFEGWYTKAEGGKKYWPQSVVDFTGDITLYAHWVEDLNTHNDSALYSAISRGNASYNSTTVYIKDAKGRAAVASFTTGKLIIYGIKTKKTTEVTLSDSFNIFGGIYQNEEYNFVLAGRENKNESKAYKTIVVYKFDRNWERLKAGYVLGGASNSFTGIYAPFVFSKISFAEQNGYLIVHTGRTMFEGSDGLHHQPNISFRIRIKDLKVDQDFTVPYVSHSFSQFVRVSPVDANQIFYFDHGDAYPRSLQIYTTSIDENNSYSKKNGKSINPVKFNHGKAGDNYTGFQMNSLLNNQTHFFVFGSSVPNNHKLSGVKGDAKSCNLYMIKVDAETLKYKYIWLTKNKPNGTTNVSNVSAVKISDDRMAVVYTQYSAKTGYSLYYMLVDSDGKVVKKAKLKTGHSILSPASLIQNSIYLVGGDWSDKTVYAYKIDVTKPTSPKLKKL
jgi:uncharacterized repeat protein (TIGR02543 family)